MAAGANATLERLKSAERDPAHRVLLKGGVVLSLAPLIGDFANGDVLVKEKKILASAETSVRRLSWWTPPG